MLEISWQNKEQKDQVPPESWKKWRDLMVIREVIMAITVQYDFFFFGLL